MVKSPISDHFFSYDSIFSQLFGRVRAALRVSLRELLGALVAGRRLVPALLEYRHAEDRS